MTKIDCLGQEGQKDSISETVVLSPHPRDGRGTHHISFPLVHCLPRCSASRRRPGFPS